MDDILILQSDPRSAANLAGALEPPHQVRFARDFLELEKLLPTLNPRVCILDVFDPSPPLPLSVLRRFRLRHLTVAIVIASDFSGKEMALYDFGRLRVDGIIRMECHPSLRDISTVVDRAIAVSLATRVVMSLDNGLPLLGQEAVRWAIENAEARPQVSAFAAAHAMNPRAFLREIRTMGLRSPRSLLLWGRLIRASQMLEGASATVESVAFHLGYATGGALGKALKHHVGCSPTELLHRGGLAWTLEEFRRQGPGSSTKGRAPL